VSATIVKPSVFEGKYFVKENRESFGIFWNVLFSTWKLQNELIIQQTCVEAALH
jgi:hypothetical protein